jgi:DNA-binding response OmpR family regulator
VTLPVAATRLADEDQCFAAFVPIVKLTPTEYALLRLLIQHRGRVLTHKQILKEVWGAEYVDETH